MGKGGNRVTGGALDKNSLVVVGGADGIRGEDPITTPVVGDTTRITNALRAVSRAELASKCTVEECWIAYEEYVYDVTRWLRKHPGGMRPIMSAAGGDATAVMKSLHAPETLSKTMGRIRRIGRYDRNGGDGNNNDNVNDNDDALQRRAESVQNDFFELNQRLVREGWYEVRLLDYVPQFLRVSAFLSFGIFAVLWGGGGIIAAGDGDDLLSWWLRKSVLVLGSASLGLFFQNLAFVGHDAGHGSVTGDIWKDSCLGLLIGNALTGIEIGWWKSTHYVHHSATNAIHDDPDIQHLPLLCFEERMADNPWSTYHGKFMPFDAVAKAIVSHQHLYFYPIMGVARINLYIQGLIYLVQTCPFRSLSWDQGSVVDESTGEIKAKYAWPRQSLGYWTLQVLTLGIFYGAWYSLLSSLDSATSVVLCVVVSHITAGLLHVQILLSHVCMNYCSRSSGIDAPHAPNGLNGAGYHEWQALSTMDVDCPPWMDWFHGGIQFQLEHHLFPRLPRWKLRSLVPLTDAIFAKYDIPVKRTPFIQANRDILAHMARIGAVVTKDAKKLD